MQCGEIHVDATCRVPRCESLVALTQMFMSEQCAVQELFWGLLSSSACKLTLLSLLPPQSTWALTPSFFSLLHDNTGRICLLIHNATKKDAGWYTVSAVNGAGVATCHARLEVASKSQVSVPQKVHLIFRTGPQD